MMLFFCIAGGIVLALLPHIIWLTGWIISKVGHFRLPYKYFGLAALTLVMLFWGAMAYGYFIGRWHFRTTHMEYVHKDIPKEFDGFKIDWAECIKRAQMYKTEEGRARLAYEEGETHHGGCGNCN